MRFLYNSIFINCRFALKYRNRFFRIVTTLENRRRGTCFFETEAVHYGWHSEEESAK